MQKNPTSQKIYLSDKLKSQLAQIPYFPLTVVTAPSGFGKTTAVREYLKGIRPENAGQYWYTCLNESPSVAWAGICDLLSNVDYELAKNLMKMGFPRVDTLMYVSACFKDISCSKEMFLVIDNYQLIQSDMLRELISVFSMHGKPRLHMIFITQPLEAKAQITFHNANIHEIEASAFFFR